MSSARDIYSLEYHKKTEEESRKINKYLHDSRYGTPATPAIAGLGLLPSHIPSRDLDNNWVDVESRLRGIGTNDWINTERRLPVEPNSKNLPCLNIVSSKPLVLPKGQKQLKDQRLRYYLGGQTIIPRYEIVQEKISNAALI